jgi:DNA-binding NtrC family response regulator
VLERALLIQSGDRLALSALLGASGIDPTASPHREPAGETGPADQVLRLEAVEQQHIVRTLAYFRGNLTHTAAALGIALSTLKRKVKGTGSVLPAEYRPADSEAVQIDRIDRRS